MTISPDVTQALWELGSAGFGFFNIRAIRKSKSIAGVHWLPTFFYFLWGIYNLWFYRVLNLPLAWWGGMAITVVNMIWLVHLAVYSRKRRKPLAPEFGVCDECTREPLHEGPCNGLPSPDCLVWCEAAGRAVPLRDHGMFEMNEIMRDMPFQEVDGKSVTYNRSDDAAAIFKKSSD